MAISLMRLGIRSVALNMERSAAAIASTSVNNQYKVSVVRPLNFAMASSLLKTYKSGKGLLSATYHLLQYLQWLQSNALVRQVNNPVIERMRCGTDFIKYCKAALVTFEDEKLLHTKPVCTGSVCFLQESPEDLSERLSGALRRYSKQHGRPEQDRRKESDSDSASDSDTECKGMERSDFWRRKMRTVHNILDVDKDGLISFNDFVLFAERFKSLGHLGESQAKEFSEIIKMTWEEQWGAIDPYNYVTVEQYLEDMHHVLNDKTLKKKAHRWLPYLFKAVDKDKSGFITIKEFKLFFKCLGLSNEHAAVAFAVIDTNGDGKLSMKEFVKLGKDFFFTEDETRVSKMFWGPLSEI